MKNVLKIVTFTTILAVGLSSCRERSLPSPMTIIINTIAEDSAVFVGYVADDGGTEVIARGVCWSLAHNPEITGNKKIIGRGTGTFTCTLSGLNPSTDYYAKAFATNEVGTAYGKEIQFKTKLDGPPVAATVATIFDYNTINYISAQVAGHIIDNGNTSVNEVGICWSYSKGPTIGTDNKTIANPGHALTGDYFSCNLDHLESDTVYYARAYIINSVDTSYGNSVTIRTLAVPVVTLNPEYEITANSVIFSGSISPGDTDDAQPGISYIDPESPEFWIEKSVRVPVDENGEFTIKLTELTPGTLYVAKTFVAWGFDPNWGFFNYILYGNEITFTTKEASSGK